MKLCTLIPIVALVSCARPQSLSDEDKVVLVKSTLEFALVTDRIPDFNLLKDTTHIILSTKNIRRNWVPHFDGFTFTVLSPDSIRSKADVEGRFLYFEFDTLQLDEAGVATVSLVNDWVLPKIPREPDVILMSGGGIILRFHKTDGHWRPKSTMMRWIR